MKGKSWLSVVLVPFALVGRAYESVLEPAEYVEANGSTYFLTSIKGVGPMTAEAKVSMPNTGVQCVLFGCELTNGKWFSPLGFTYGTPTSDRLMMRSDDSKWLPNTILVPENTWTVLTGTITADGRTAAVDGTEVYSDKVGSSATEEVARQMAILAENKGAYNQNYCISGTRLAYLKVWRSADKSGDPDAWYVPVRDKTTGITYLKDTISGELLRANPDKKPETVWVSPDGSDDSPGCIRDIPKKTVSAALDATAAEVVLLPGTYPLTSTLTLISGRSLRGYTGNPRDVVLDGCGANRTGIKFSINQTRDMLVESLTVSNCYESASGTVTGAAGITAAGNYWKGEGAVAFSTISNCIVTCCTVASGTYRQAVAIGSYARLVDSVVTSNACNGIRLDSGGEVIGSEISRNEAGVCGYCYGSGVDANNGTARMTVRGCTISGNRAMGVDDVVRVLDSRIERNVGAPCGLRYWAILQSSLASRSETVYVVSNCVVSCNTGSTDTAQGALLVNGNSGNFNRVLIDSCVVASNSVAYYPFMISANASTRMPAGAVCIRNTLVTGNRAIVKNGNTCGIYATGLNSDGGADVRAVFENCTVAENAAVNAVVGACYLNNSRVAITNCVFANNRLKTSGDLSEQYGHGVASNDGGWNAEGVFGYNYLHPDETDKTFAAAQHVINGTPGPRFAEGTLIPRHSSPLTGNGLVLPWMTGACDLRRDDDGTPVGAAVRARLTDGKVNIGAYESFPSAGLMLLLR